MTNEEQKLREIAYKHAEPKVIWNDGNMSIYPDEEKIESLLSDLTALISEHYVSREDVNQEVERRIAETVAGKFIAVEIEKRIADRQLTDEQIERQFTTSHYHYEKGHYYKVRQDRIFGAKWYRSRLTNPGVNDSQKTEGGGE